MKKRFKSLKLSYVIIAVIILILLLIIFNIKSIIAQSSNLIVTFKNKLITVTYNPQSSSDTYYDPTGGDDAGPGPGDDDDDDDDDGTDGDV